MNTAGLPVKLQFGEESWWYFAGSGTGMAYYDAYTSAQAASILGRSLYSFLTPNDNPNVNAFADANLLVSLLQNHLHTIRVNVISALSPVAVIFEWLYPYDVNRITPYSNSIVSSPLGGQLNYYVNTPADYKTTGNDIDTVLMESLGWGVTYRVMDNQLDTMRLPLDTWSWPASKVRYLIPWTNYGCPWQKELMYAQTQGYPEIKFWASDHGFLMSWLVIQLLNKVQLV